MTIVIDTNAYSAMKAGDAEVKTFLEEIEHVVVPIIVIGELLSGFQQGNRFSRNSTELDSFLRQPGITVCNIGFAEADRYASLIKALKKAGTPVPTNDVWISAIAIGSGGRLLTRDTHFDKIPGVVPISW